MRWVVIGLVGCGGLPAGFEAELVNEGGCGDVLFYAFDDADRVLLRVSVAKGLVSGATAAGESRTTTVDLPDPDSAVEVHAGRRISTAMCTDLIVNGGPRVRRTWTATGGQLTITIEPGQDEWDARGSLEVRDLVLESEGGATATLPALDLADVGVGWLAG